VSSPLKESARRLVIALHQTVAKNAGGEEWSKAVRELVKDTHVTADNVFRAVIEDWESTAGYVGGPIDANQVLSGGGKSADDLPQWNGIVAGVERLAGLLEMLAEYFRSETSTPVSIPLGSITDLVTRMLSIAMPASDSSSRQGSARLHPAIDRDEKDGLWCGMPQVYIAALQVVVAVVERLQVAFMPLAQGILDQLVWVYPFGRSHPEFRLVTYVVVAKVLLHIGQSFDKAQVGKLGSIMRSCCRDLQPVDPDSHSGTIVEDAGKKSHGHHANQNADTFLQNKNNAVDLGLDETDLTVAARSLLPLLLSHVPQQHVDVSLRSLIERTAILSHDKDAMLASILNPFVGKNGKAMATVLPHLTRDFGQDMAVEVLLRPRMPLVPTSGARVLTEDGIQEESEDEDMEFNSINEVTQGLIQRNAPFHAQSVSEHPGLSPVLAPAARSTHLESSNVHSDDAAAVHSGYLGLGPAKGVKPHVAASTEFSFSQSSHTSLAPELSTPMDPAMPSRHSTTIAEDVKMDSGDESSDDESVHLTMELDTDSE
jgi:hypothetical protein